MIPAGSAASEPLRRLCIYLIKPSKYDDDGQVIRYWRGVLPSNTLACLYGLTDDVRRRGALGRGLRWRIELIDETVQRVDVARILRAARAPGTAAIACLAGVQSNQFPRAADLARALRAGGVQVLLGGFHVSGSLAMLPTIPPEIQAVIDDGVTVVAGEIEGRWEQVLADVLRGAPQPVYNFLAAPPDLRQAPLPQVTRRYLQRFVAPNFTTLDCGRGCPFACSFCTVINVQGRTMRFRDAACLLAMVRENYRRLGIRAYFFTDDNFCRNRHWEAILDGLIRLRAEEGIRVSFMIQADTQSYRLPRFIEKAAAAGCTQVFIGMESLNPRNLGAAGKRQNRVEEFRALIEAYRAAGINTHVAYIIGFPFDTPASVRADLQRLMTEVGPEQASFFMLTPLPGSQDHVALLRAGAELDADLNQYDSFHATTAHPAMSREAWSRAYDEAWRSFYSPKNMIRILRRVSPENYWSVFANFIWYKNAVEVEGGHPMIQGFIRLRGRTERRPGMPPRSRRAHLAGCLAQARRYLRGWPTLAFEMQEVWLQTRPRGALEQRVVEELQRLGAGFGEWRRVRAQRIRAAYAGAVERLHGGMAVRLSRQRAIPTWFELWLNRWNPFTQTLTWSRRPLNRFWRRSRAAVRRGAWHRISMLMVGFNGLQELGLFAVFAATFFHELLRRLFSRRATA